MTVHTVQKLTGILNFLNRAIVPGRVFTRRMYAKISTCSNNGKKLKQYHHVSVDSEFKKDCLVWKFFLDNVDKTVLCRPFIDIDKFSESLTLNFFTDASLNRCYSFGGIFGNRWIVGRWGSDFIDQQKPSIEYLEFYALLAGILTWGSDTELCNTRVVIFCDNKAVVHMINNYTSGCKKCMKLLRMLALDNLQHNRRVFVKYVASADNDLVDSLSRMQFKRFWRLAPKTMNRQPDKIPDSIWPVEKLWFD